MMSAMLWKVGFILRKFVKVIIGCGLFYIFFCPVSVATDGKYSFYEISDMRMV